MTSVREGGSEGERSFIDVQEAALDQDDGSRTAVQGRPTR